MSVSVEELVAAIRPLDEKALEAARLLAESGIRPRVLVRKSSRCRPEASASFRMPP